MKNSTENVNEARYYHCTATTTSGTVLTWAGWALSSDDAEAKAFKELSRGLVHIHSVHVLGHE